MVKPEWGTKRSCTSCSAVFYDLNKMPAQCPKCGTLYESLAQSGRGKKGRSSKGKNADDAIILDIDSSLESDDVLLDDDSSDDSFDVFSTSSDKDDED